MQQLPLAIQFRAEADFTDYLPGPNREAVAAVKAWSTGSGASFVYLFGASGTGKTHLLQAACRTAAGRSQSTIYLPLAHPGLDPSALESLERADLVALDDLQEAVGDEAWERDLFGLYNRLQDSATRLLVSADVPAPELPVRLPDLHSRLGSGPGYRLRRLPEGDCERLLKESANRRGLDLSADAIDFIMRRCPRDAGYLLGLLERLDQLSLREKRRPTRWLIRQLLDASE